jgi:hypothetical protein
MSEVCLDCISELRVRIDGSESVPRVFAVATLVTTAREQATEEKERSFMVVGDVKKTERAF